MKILVTGCAGFIGYHLSLKILKESNHVLHGIDNLNNYYDLDLKKKRIKLLKNLKKKFIFSKIDIYNESKIDNLFKLKKFDCVINLAAQAGVRYSLKNPKTYLDNNINGFFNILNFSKEKKVKNLIFASTSSVYGNAKKFPLKESYDTSSPIQMYAATKKTNELMAHAYSHLYKMKITGLRFFTVYGPWGRPDMALSIFTKSIIEKKAIKLFNYGNHTRDFTYVDDIVSGIIKLIYKKNNSKSKFKIFNLGNNKPITLKKYIWLIEKNLKIKAKKKYLPLQAGDVEKTHSNTNLLKKEINFIPKTKPEKGIFNFIKWYLEYYKITL